MEFTAAPQFYQDHYNNIISNSRHNLFLDLFMDEFEEEKKPIWSPGAWKLCLVWLSMRQCPVVMQVNWLFMALQETTKNPSSKQQ